MLVLSRKVGERVVIDGGDGEIVLRVLKTPGGRVQLGVEAPRPVRVRREARPGANPTRPGSPA